MLALPLVLLLACGGKSSSSAPLATPAPVTDVYVAGSADLPTATGANHVAVIWKNGIPVNLTDGSNDAEANAAIVAGTTLYVVGYENNGNHDVARIWTCDTGQPFKLKAFTATTLTDGTNDARALHLTAAGTDLFVAGMENNGTADVAKIWKHDAAAPFANQAFASANLSAGVFDAAAYAVTSDGTRLYASGYAGDGSNHLATLWTYDLTTTFGECAFASMPLNADSDAYANDVRVFDGRVWIAGTLYSPNALEAKPEAQLWSLNPALLVPRMDFFTYFLKTGSLGSEAFAVTESAGVIYVAGYEANSTSRVAKIWSTPLNLLPFKTTDLSQGLYDAKASDVAVLDGVVYACGSDVLPPFPKASPKVNTQAMSWQDGVGASFTDGSTNATANGIFVKAK
jgi:hypothetical protein